MSQLQPQALQAQPIIAWMGGKRRLLRHLLPLVESVPHDCYCEPFAGGAALFFAKQPVKVEVVNDLNSDLVNLYRVVAHHLDEFVRQFRWALVSRELFRWLGDTPPHTLTDIQRAARFFYLQGLCFGAKPTGRTFGTATTAPPKLNLLRIEERLSEAHMRLARAYIEHLDWATCLQRYDRPHTLTYLDPPYWQTEGYGLAFGWDQYEQIADLMAKAQGKVVLSHSDHPDIRALFGRWRCIEAPLTHSVGGRGGKVVVELIYCNW